MKRIFLSLVILACLSSTTLANAQNQKKENRRSHTLSKELNLSDEQQEKIKSINKDFKIKIDELKAKNDLAKDEKRTKTKELRAEQKSAINNLLTLEQKAKLEEPKGNRQKSMAMHSKRDNKNMKAHSNKHQKNLNLTDDQKQKIKELNKDFGTKSKELAQQHRDALNNVYTPEQKDKLKESRQNFSDKHRHHSFNKNRGTKDLDEASKNKLTALYGNFQKEKEAIKLSRIAPDAQKKKIFELRENFRKERGQIIKDAKKVQDKKTV